MKPIVGFFAMTWALVNFIIFIDAFVPAPLQSESCDGPVLRASIIFPSHVIGCWLAKPLVSK